MHAPPVRGNLCMASQLDQRPRVGGVEPGASMPPATALSRSDILRTASLAPPRPAVGAVQIRAAHLFEAPASCRSNVVAALIAASCVSCGNSGTAAPVPRPACFSVQTAAGRAVPTLC